MANYYADARSNYFRVRSEKAFTKFCEIFGLEKITKDSDPNLVGFISAEQGVPNGYTAQDGEFVEQDFILRLSRQLKPGEVAILMETGSEKMRYLTGYAVAVNANGAHAHVSLDEIYTKVQVLTDDPEHVLPCEY